MNHRTQVIIGATLVLIGLGVYALGYLEDESGVRYVADIEARPERHVTGPYTLLGVPQPPTLATVGSDGSSRIDDNPAYHNQTVRVRPWTDDDGTLLHSTHTLTVDATDDGTTWTLRNETRRAGAPGLWAPATEDSWSLDGRYHVFLVAAFSVQDGDTPAVFGVFDGVLKEPMQPKPSQFKGRVATALPDGTLLPDGAVVYWVEEYTAGCSSKFLPPEWQDQDEAPASAT